MISRDKSSETLLKAIKCFNSWIPVLEDINAALGCELIPEVFQILTDPPVSLSIWDFLVCRMY